MKLIIASVCCFLILTSATAGSRKLRIFGGSGATIGQFPYQVSLRDKYNQHFCGGSILNPTTILTAAQCVCGAPQICSFIVSGANKLSSGGKFHSVSNRSIICHPNYDRENGLNDIALIKLTTPLEFSATVGTVQLPSSDVAQNLIFSGWGWVGWSLSRSIVSPNKTDDLQYIQMKPISLETCMMQLTQTGYVLSTGNLCAIADPIGGGACKGDSGGPLVSEGVQYGINSWIYDCQSRTPSVFINVYNYKAWIESYLY